SAYLLVALVALAYIVSYVLLQMETYALLTGSLILFLLLAVVMYFTRNLNKKEETRLE
ncbi:MAG: inner membrane CreD family protein, partial [Bacteroidales bacterium]|nr:inner membrane CreD family protein [Bacteroidales bacterium]